MLLSDDTLEKIRAEISRYPQPRGALLTALHVAREELRGLSPELFAELAPLFGLKTREVAEVASFYSLFNQPPARAIIQVCTNLPCCLNGARAVVRALEARLGIRAGSATADGRFALVEVECLGSCASAPVVQVNQQAYLENVTPEFAAGLTVSPEAALGARQPAAVNSWFPPEVAGYLLPPGDARWLELGSYGAQGGWQALARAAAMAPGDLCKLVQESGLRGRGGAGFVTGMKWTFMPPKDGRPRYLAVNADESEPGTFKDRQIMERNPFLLIEGIMIAAHAILADAAFIYVRGEYVDAYRILRQAIADAYQAGILGEQARALGRRLDVHVQRGAGAYICGEESGMLESMEGRKGQPRKRPPFPAQRGLWDQPTTVDNVETLSHLPAIVQNGAQWFKTQGAEKSSGHTLFGVSGHVKRPGVIELPLGTRLSDIIFKHCGGLPEGRRLKAIVPGGVSMPVLKAEQADVAMDHESLRAAGTLLGTGGVIVLDDRSCMVRAALVVARFFAHESCGQCTQCREGTGWTLKILRRIENGQGKPEDLDAIADCCFFMDGKCICALADGAAWAARAFLTQFRGEFERHIKEGRCPFPESFEV